MLYRWWTHGVLYSAVLFCTVQYRPARRRRERTAHCLYNPLSSLPIMMDIVLKLQMATFIRLQISRTAWYFSCYQSSPVYREGGICCPDDSNLPAHIIQYTNIQTEIICGSQWSDWALLSLPDSIDFQIEVSNRLKFDKKYLYDKVWHGGPTW